ncbi:ADP-ribosylhydrolase ARH3 isoform X1 [Eleutherodactylus coqui]|uniref:ADP-ribosylhydrolase ARH3 n=1 Tax=Eleutherodactylus coqui TaxID=57060 RepID=A0A8J6KGB5_ELECQ|nr:hypothetical protein GDO78_001029 [Eleutherodactylus coqui]
MALVELRRFRGSLLGALVGDCFGSLCEGLENVSVEWVHRFVHTLGGRADALMYTDDTAMARSLVQSLLEKPPFDEKDLAQRFTTEYFNDPDRGYGLGVVHVFEKLQSGEYCNVFTPAKEQFNGKGSYGNGAAMRVVGVPLAFPCVQDVIKYAKISGELTHASSLGYNGAILLALAVHYALQGNLSRESFLGHLLSNMQEVEADEKSRSDAVGLELGEFPYCNKLKKVKEFLDKGNVSCKDIIDELGNGVSALDSVPTAIYSFLRCLDPVDDVPKELNSLQRTVIFCILLGGDTDTIATMAGAIAGAYHGEDQIPEIWRKNSEGYKDAENWGKQLWELYNSRLPE